MEVSFDQYDDNDEEEDQNVADDNRLYDGGSTVVIFVGAGRRLNIFRDKAVMDKLQQNDKRHICDI